MVMVAYLSAFGVEDGNKAAGGEGRRGRLSLCRRDCHAQAFDTHGYRVFGRGVLGFRSLAGAACFPWVIRRRTWRAATRICSATRGPHGQLVRFNQRLSSQARPGSTFDMSGRSE